jgi:DNA-binding response OmpR family regulator
LIQQVFTLGANDFVTKPIVGPEIIARITNLMERQQVQQLKIDRWQHRVAIDRSQLATQVKLQAALMTIADVVRSENLLQTDRHQILEQVDLLRQLLLTAPE